MMDRSGNVEDALPPGTRIEEFEIERALPSGDFGVTYLAQDRSLGRRVAIKEYLPREWGGRRSDGSVGPRSSSCAGDYRWGLARFLEEARTLARLDHPRIVRVHRVIEAWGTAYMVMEYVEGRNLEEALKAEGPWPEARVRALLEALLPGVALVHAAGLIHRDVKPANVMLRADGTPVLIDFGAARYAAGAHSHSLTSVLTPGYAPFEQYQTGGKQGAWKQGAWTDVYALGAVAYRALSGRAPAEAPRRLEAAARRQPDPLVPVSEAAADGVSEVFGWAVTSALAVWPEDRPRYVTAWRAQWDVKVPRFRGAGRPVAAALVVAAWLAFGIVNRVGGCAGPGTYSPVLGRAWSASHVEENGLTDLHYAAVLNRPDLARRLLDAGASIDAPFRPGGNRGQLMEALRAFDAPVAGEAVSELGWTLVTPLALSVFVGAGDVAELLLDRGANIEAVYLGYGPLHAAVDSGSVAMVELLLDRGANIEAEDGISGNRPLHAAVDSGSVAMVELLLDRGANIEAVPGGLGLFGNRPLHAAARSGSVAMVELLLDRGANVEATDFGQTPLDLARNDAVRSVLLAALEGNR